ncbi:hypothetical protein ACYATM_06230 [Lactobacillaceae bacterium Scapto_B20]
MPLMYIVGLLAALIVVDQGIKYWITIGMAQGQIDSLIPVYYH